MKKTGLALAVSAIVLSSTFANAQTLAQRKHQQSQTESFQTEVKSMNEKCGFNLPAEIDYSGFKPEDYTSNNSFYGYCQAPVNAIFMMCRDDKKLEIEAVKAKVKKIVCKRGEARAAELKDGTLNYTIDFKSANDDEFINKFFGDNL